MGATFGSSAVVLGRVSSVVLTALSIDLGLVSDLLKSLRGHLLGFICPSSFICSFLNFLFAYHLPPRQPKPYLQ